MTPSAIASHLKMTGQLVDAHVVTEIRNMPERGLSELSIITHDAPGLFAKIAGVLSLNGIGIIDAQLFTLPNGTVIDLLWITDLTGQPLENEKRWNDIRKQLKDAITGVLDVRHAMKRQSIKRLLTPNRDPADTRIEIDNDVAPQETVVDVITHDRQGLLYDISQTFFELGCTIDRAKITTYADRVIDAFYIRDAKGEKITARDRLRQLQEAIANAVS
jgi:[protein-PII] uridylyltransferase